jgi:hypothetical protein
MRMAGPDRQYKNCIKISAGTDGFVASPRDIQPRVDACGECVTFPNIVSNTRHAL